MQNFSFREHVIGPLTLLPGRAATCGRGYVMFGGPVVCSRKPRKMPAITRWFKVSHDINADPEMWAMRRQIGEKSLSIWLEFLSIADRNKGVLPGELEELIRLVAGRCQATRSTVTAVYQAAVSRMWLTCEPTLRVSKWSKYNKRRETHQHPLLDNTIQDNTKQTKEEKNKRAQAPLVLPDWVPQEAWFGYCEYRKNKNKSGWTKRAAILNLNKLEQLKKAGHDPEGVLNQSVANGWAGLFPLRSENEREHTSKEPKGFNGLREWRKLRGLKS